MNNLQLSHINIIINIKFFFFVYLFLLGLGTGSNSNSVDSNRDAYLQLSVTVLAAFCRVPEIASSEDMVAKIPFIVEIMSKE